MNMFETMNIIKSLFFDLDGGFQTPEIGYRVFFAVYNSMLTSKMLNSCI